MTDLAAEVTQAIVSGAAGRLAAGGIEAAGRLAAALRAKLRGDAAGRGTLEIALEEPGDAEASGNLEDLLRERASADAAFAAWLEALWAEAGPDLKAGGTSNIVRGTVHGDVIQAGNVDGGIHIGRRDGSPVAGDAG